MSLYVRIEEIQQLIKMGCNDTTIIDETGASPGLIAAIRAGKHNADVNEQTDGNKTLLNEGK